jgi:hypothetical protein
MIRWKDRKLEGSSSLYGVRRCAVLLACVSVAFPFSVVASTTALAPSFAGPTFYRAGGFTNTVAISDLNGDGKRDLVAANGDQYFPSVSVLLNRGDGRFRARVNYEAGGGEYGTPSSVATGDLNGDRKVDLATANSEDANTVSVLLNRGDGRFRAKRDYAIGAGASSIAIGDLNGDRNPDLAIAKRQNTVSVLLNKGDGSFGAKVDYRTGRGPSSVAIGDLNGDARPDLATANYDGSTVSVLENRGDGRFPAKADYGTGRGPKSVAIGDLNGDRRPDLTTANCGRTSSSSPCGANSNTVSVLLNRGDGSFQAKVDHRTGRMPQAVAVGDLNGDGKPELVTANLHFKAQSVSVLVNQGAGRFAVKRDHPAGYGPVSVAIGDLNGDRRLDLATAIMGERGQFDSRVSVLTNAIGFCGVPNLFVQTLRTAKGLLARAHCSVGSIHRAYSGFDKGRVIAQKPGAGRLLPVGGKVSLVLSRGPRP